MVGDIAFIVQLLDHCVSTASSARRIMTIPIIRIALLLNAVLITVVGTSETEKNYAVVVDAGSTGSRAFIFGFFTDEKGHRQISSTVGTKVSPGLSEFVENPEDAVEYMLPTFLDAAQIIPKHKHISTKIYIKGTAGMRLLPEDQQTRIWDTLYEGLDNIPSLPFIVDRMSFGSLRAFVKSK